MSAEDNLQEENFELIGEAEDEDGNRVRYVRDRREARSGQHTYTIPDYALNSLTYQQHQKDVNWVSVVMSVLAIITLLGGIVAAWIAMSERMAKAETLLSTHITSDVVAIDKIVKQLDTNTDDLLREHYDTNAKIYSLKQEDQELSRNIKGILQELKRHESAGHPTTRENRAP